MTQSLLDDLVVENHKFQIENADLKFRIKELEGENEKLTTERSWYKSVRAENKKLKDICDKKHQEMLKSVSESEEVIKLNQRIKELEDQIVKLQTKRVKDAVEQEPRIKELEEENLVLGNFFKECAQDIINLYNNFDSTDAKIDALKAKP